MQNECQIYVDPEEDEVFFGCVSEVEKTISNKLANHAVPSSKNDTNLNNIREESVLDVDVNLEKQSGNDQTIVSNKEVKNESPKSLLPNEKVTESNKASDTSVEQEHNYSTPMKHKIDKSILATPKSIVKADRDGGFLKVLSEIALVKAEVEGDSNSETKKDDENKENKIIGGIPEIKVTEATPEKGFVASPPNAMTTEFRRFRIIYNSPRNEDNVNYKSKSKSNGDSFEKERNVKNKLLDEEVENRRRKSVDLIDFTNSTVLLENDEKKSSNEEHSKEKKPLCDVITLTDSSDSDEKEINIGPPVRFSKEARKIVEVLKKSTIDDTLNFTIPEIDVEEEENSFFSPEPPPAFDETVISNQNQPNVGSPTISNEQPPIKAKTEEKRTQFHSQTKNQPIKYFSDRKIYNNNGCETKKCVKRLPMDDKRPAIVEKVNGTSHQLPSSKIPVFGAKNSKIPLSERVARPAGPKTTPLKTPSAKTFKNPKFNHIESPINAYIHNKPTALVLNVKPELKKESLTKVWKSQTGSGKKPQEKPSKEQIGNSVIKQLPFVEYKSATAYKIEKRTESRLPRLAPTVYKLIGSNSPKVLRHEGRFYLNSPRKEKMTENTLIADPNEVSVVVSQPAQKSHTIK